MSLSGAEAHLGYKIMKASNAANDPDDPKVAGRQLESSAPAEARAEPAAHSSLPAGENGQVDALPTGTEVEAERKNKKKQKKRQREMDSYAAASQPPSDDQSHLTFKPKQKKHKGGKVRPCSSIPGFVLPLDDTPTSGDTDLLAPHHMLKSSNSPWCKAV